MSRYLPHSQLPRVYQPTVDHVNQRTILDPVPYDHLQHARSIAYGNPELYSHSATFDVDVSDDTCTDTNSCCDFHHCDYQYASEKESRTADRVLPINDGSIRLPDYKRSKSSTKDFSRNNLADYGFNKEVGRFCSLNSSMHPGIRPLYSSYKDAARVQKPIQTGIPLQVPLSDHSDRPQSSLSSGVTSAIVDGCGGHCQTFENVFYYFLQVAFTMGILIGASLSIAGTVLRKSAARNLQVLVYIGVLLSMVSSLLLAIQCSARYSARRRKKALRNAKRAPIQLENMQSRAVAATHQPLMEQQGQRNPSVIQMQITPMCLQPQTLTEHQGIPWWRRQDLT